MSILRTIGTLFGDLGRARAALQTYERLNAMRDSRLNARGLARDDLAATSFNRHFGK
jgi:hypothetical protein